MSPLSPKQIFQFIKSRRSIRRYTYQPISKKLILRLLEAAKWAPSAHNRQPWRFAILRQAANREQLVQAMGDRLRADRMADGDDPDDIEQDVARSYIRLMEAPVLIVVCLSMGDMDRYSDIRRNRNEWIMAVQSVAMAAQNLQLQAHAEGLASCWVCAPLFVPQLVSQTLNLPSDWEPQGFLTLGYPAEKKKKSRDPITEKVLFF